MGCEGLVQHIRPSQFIITYGPGAILETRYGPRVIPMPNIGLSSLIPQRLNEFEISDRRITEGLFRGSARIFRIPSNAELNMPEDIPLYRTKPFPEWKLCLNTSSHPSGGYVLFRGNACPECKRSQSTPRPARFVYQEPIRFIMACPKGHMDDVDWYVVVHSEKRDCTNDEYFIWRGSGPLRSIQLECPRCRRRRNLGEAYRADYECTGRYPEREGIDEAPRRPRNCGRAAKIIQRQASNLRIPELRILFTVPPRYTRLHGLLQLQPIYISVMNGIGSKEELARRLDRLVERGFISEAVRAEILSHEWGEIAQAIEDIMTPVPRSYDELLKEEFHALIEGSVRGIPPRTGPRPGSPPLIEIDPNQVRRVEGPNGHALRIVPVLHLHAIMIQVGYRRDIPAGDEEPELVDIGFSDPNNPGGPKWYPGVELFGEGIFIMLDGDCGWHFELKGENTRRWREAFDAESGNERRFHPVFVWWHTLSHLLIRSVSLDAGYSSASIRERVYLEIEEEQIRGGILLYATQPGSDGTLGGLIALVPYFERILERALELSKTCSCDPLCLETKFSRGRYNGAACYACLLLSETSCEHRNMWLDRNVLIENMP